MRAPILFLCFFCSQLSAQRIADFFLSQSGTAVTIKFTVRGGSPVNGYSILHSTDSLNFTTVIDKFNTIGMSGADEFFTETHNTPLFNQMNYYKVQLFGVETSPARKIFVGNGSGGQVTVYPNPVYDNGLVRFKLLNGFNLRLQGSVYDMMGNIRSSVDLTTSGDTAVFDASQLDNGPYALWLTDGAQAYSTKFIVLR